MPCSSVSTVARYIVNISVSAVGMMPCSSVTTVARYSEYLGVYSRYDALFKCQYSSSLIANISVSAVGMMPCSSVTTVAHL